MSQANGTATLPPALAAALAKHPPTRFAVYEKGRRDVDLWVTKWWFKMEADGDLRVALSDQCQSLGELFGLISSPTKYVLFATDEDGIWFAAWFEPSLSGVFMGAWCAKEYRHRGHGRRGLNAFLDAWEWGLQRWPVVIGITKQPAILDEHRRLGYTIHGPIPQWFDGKSTWIMHLTQGSFTPVFQRLRKRYPSWCFVDAHPVGF